MLHRLRALLPYAPSERKRLAMPRSWVWLQLIVGWLPMWGLYTLLIVTAHPGTGVSNAAFVALRAIGLAAVLGVVVFRLTDRLPWPHPLTARFVAIHVAGAVLYAALWSLLTILLEVAMQTAHPQLDAPSVRLTTVGFRIIGVWFYVMVVGITYATQATQRAARAEASAARSQLAALRSQLNPHFLFNALHTVVQLIPLEPKRAVQAAEQLAGLLRTTIEENRDVVTVDDEWSFVQRYLELERIRFGDRLAIVADLSPEAMRALMPSFALQTLVENAVRHGASPHVEPTTVTIGAHLNGRVLSLSVDDTGVGATAGQLAGSQGTGIVRLGERLQALTGGSARLTLTPGVQGGFRATLVVPQESLE